MWFIILNLLTVLAIVYFYIKKKYSYWSSLGVSGPKPSLLAFGNAFQISSSTNVPETEVGLVRKFGEVYGTYSILNPTVTIADPEMIKQVMVKDFHFFVNRRKTHLVEELLNMALFNAEDDSWKRIRGITSPAFTSGKLRSVQPIVQSSVDKLVAYFNRLTSQKTENSGLINDPKKVFYGFTIDSIASAAFATETNANDDRCTENTLVKYATKLGDVGQFRVLSALLLPRWFNALIGVDNFMNPTSFAYMKKLAETMIKGRKSQGVKRADLLQQLIDSEISEEELKKASYQQLADMEKNDTLSNDFNKVSKGQKNKLSDKEIISQCILFFGAGHSTTGDALLHAIFELSHDQKSQNRLIKELHDALDNLDTHSEEYFDAVLGATSLPFMNAVISETLRKYPPLNRLERRCSQEGYKLAGLSLQKDQIVEIACYGVHYNPKYFPEPETFKPERFLPENKDKLVPYSYLPFGQGPRNCVGMRFAYQEIKMCLATVCRQFRFEPTSKTPKKLAFLPFKFAVETEPFEVFVVKQ